MFCPVCNGEYVEGVSRCADCDADLVAALPAPADHPSLGDFETVFGTADPVLLMTVKALLEEAGIPYLARGEGMQDLFGLGRLGTGFNLVVGPMEVQVPTARRQEAEDLLRQAKLEQVDEESGEGTGEGSEEEEEGEERGDG
jgi:hypothetical protein